MTFKAIMTAGLLGFVAISLCVAVADVAGWRVRRAGPPTEGVAATEVNASRLKGDLGGTAPHLAAIFFHASHRCPTCRKIEAFSREALQSDIQGGKLSWQTADYTAAENAALVDKLHVLSSTVVLAEKRGEQIVRWKNLEEVWDHTHDQPEFTDYVLNAWKDFQETP